MYPSVQLLSASRLNLRLLILIRVLVLAAQAGSVGLAYATQLMALPWLELGITLSFSAALCLITAIRLHGPWPVTEVEYAIHLAFDLCIHSILLYLSGGSTNPFVSYYLVPLTIAAATLPWLFTLVLAGLALGSYTFLLMWYDPLGIDPVHQATLQVYGMWLSFALAAVLITFFVARMAEELRRQEQRQAARREESLRDQQLLAVAAQAAGAAHELGTPLATMSVLLNELRQDATDPQLQEDLTLLQAQVRLCKDSLQHLVRAAEADRRQAVSEQTAAEWMEAVLQRWHLMRPEASYRYECLGRGGVPRLMPSADLSQALMNLLNNATDACPDNLSLRLDWDAEQIRITILDQGPGVPLAIAEQIGRPFFTTKGGKGLGLGLFLSQASVNRAGGTVKLYNHEEGGTLTELCLPYGLALA